MSGPRLTGGEYWEAGYAAQGADLPLRLDDYRYLAERRILERLEGLGISGKRILEVGAGNSAILSYLARTHWGQAEFSGLDYSKTGCQLLARRAEREGAVIEVIHQDLFDPTAELLGRFDLIFSLGVVEHFTSLADALAAKGRLLAPGGRIFTLIPNMAGLIGRFTRRYNPRVYALHLPHDLRSFLAGHARAGLEVRSSGYVCSTNFGVLSSCFLGAGDRGYDIYRWLSRVTKLLWLAESRLGDLPHSAVLSPYLYAVSSAGP